MKNRVLLILGFFLITSYVNAVEKPLKIGYVKVEYIMAVLPDTKQLQVDLQAFEKQINSQLEAKAAELREKLQAFQQGHSTMTDAMRAQKEEELHKLHGNFEKFQMSSQASFTSKQIELLKPIQEKLQKAIEAVAKENKYTHVLNSDASGLAVILYAEKEYDMTDLVIKKLGIDPAKAAKELKALEELSKQIQEAKTQTTVKKVEDKKPKTNTKK
jgi:outer membrane protein